MKPRELHGEDVIVVEFEAPFGVGRRGNDLGVEDEEILLDLAAYVGKHPDRYLGAVTIEHLDRDGDGAIDTARWVAYFHRAEGP